MEVALIATCIQNVRLSLNARQPLALALPLKSIGIRHLATRD